MSLDPMTEDQLRDHLISEADRLGYGLQAQPVEDRWRAAFVRPEPFGGEVVRWSVEAADRKTALKALADLVRDAEG